MPEKVTSLNGLKVTSECWSYKVDAYNKDYVKSRKFNINNQMVRKSDTPSVLKTYCGSLRNNVRSWILDALISPLTRQNQAQLSTSQRAHDTHARQIISRELGHERSQITSVYLGR